MSDVVSTLAITSRRDIQSLAKTYNPFRLLEKQIVKLIKLIFIFIIIGLQFSCSGVGQEKEGGNKYVEIEMAFRSERKGCPGFDPNLLVNYIDLNCNPFNFSGNTLLIDTTIIGERDYNETETVITIKKDIETQQNISGLLTDEAISYAFLSKNDTLFINSVLDNSNDSDIICYFTGENMQIVDGILDSENVILYEGFDQLCGNFIMKIVFRRHYVKSIESFDSGFECL